MSDSTSSPCSSLPVIPFGGFRIYWNRPATVGYDTYFPSNAYGIDYYRIQVSRDPFNFDTLAGSVTCVIGQLDQFCKFDRRIAAVTGLTVSQIYYYRVLAVTIVGDGQNASVMSSPMIYINCSAGNFIDSSGLCASCVAGTYKSSSGSASCTACPVGTYTNIDGATVCTQCVGNTTSASNSTVCACKSGFYEVPSSNASATNETSCTACDTGSYTNTTGASACTACDAGTYTDTAGASACLTCAAGTYKDSSGPGNCTMCPVNTISLTVGSVSVSDCVCALGYEWNQSYPLRRLLQEDVTYNCLPGEERILVTDPVLHYLCRPLPPPPPLPPTPPPSPPPPPLPLSSTWNFNLSPMTNLYASDNYSLTRRLLQMERRLFSEVCIRCESHFYKDTVSNSRCHQCPADMFSQDGVNCAWKNVSASAFTTVAATPVLPRTTPVSDTTTYPITTTSVTLTQTIPDTTPTPKTQSSGYVVKMVVSLPLTRQEFNDSEQIKFKQSVARAAVVSSDDVSIDRIADMNDSLPVLRRLLTTGIRVDTSVKASDETAVSAISTSLTTDSLNSALVEAGLPTATILEVSTFVSDRQMTTTPMSTPVVIPVVQSESDSNLATVLGGAVGGLLFVCLVLCARLYCQFGRKSTAT